MSAKDSVPEAYIRSIESQLNSLPEPIRDALSKVRRHRFLDGWFVLDPTNIQMPFRRAAFDRNDPSPEDLAEVYSNSALVTMHDGNFPTSSTSQPSLVAEMLQLLDVKPGMRVLEIGTGTGYNAALLAELCGDPGLVFTIEWQASVADSARRFLLEEGYGTVHVACGDGYHGMPEGAPYDRIIATVGCSDISPHWLEQLTPDGAILVPLQHGFSDPIVRLGHGPQPGTAAGRVVTLSGFMKIHGILEWNNPWFSFRILGNQDEPVWRRPMPEDLALPDGSAGHPFGSPAHRSFYFFLALGSRELWYDNFGYGLADPGSHSIVRLTARAIEGLTAQSDPEALEQLYERLMWLHRTWIALGRPSPCDYSIDLAIEDPVHPLLSGSADAVWHIVRPRYLETVRLDPSILE